MAIDEVDNLQTNQYLTAYNEDNKQNNTIIHRNKGEVK
jgi:hypothetical protein